MFDTLQISLELPALDRHPRPTTPPSSWTMLSTASAWRVSRAATTSRATGTCRTRRRRSRRRRFRGCLGRANFGQALWARRCWNLGSAVRETLGNTEMRIASLASSGCVLGVCSGHSTMEVDQRVILGRPEVRSGARSEFRPDTGGQVSEFAKTRCFRLGVQRGSRSQDLSRLGTLELGFSAKLRGGSADACQHPSLERPSSAEIPHDPPRSGLRAGDSAPPYGVLEPPPHMHPRDVPERHSEDFCFCSDSL